MQHPLNFSEVKNPTNEVLETLKAKTTNNNGNSQFREGARFTLAEQETAVVKATRGGVAVLDSNGNPVLCLTIKVKNLETGEETFIFPSMLIKEIFVSTENGNEMRQSTCEINKALQSLVTHGEIVDKFCDLVRGHTIIVHRESFNVETFFNGKRSLQPRTLVGFSFAPEVQDEPQKTRKNK